MVEEPPGLHQPSPQGARARPDRDRRPRLPVAGSGRHRGHRRVHPGRRPRARAPDAARARAGEVRRVPGAGALARTSPDRARGLGAGCHRAAPPRGDTSRARGAGGRGVAGRRSSRRGPGSGGRHGRGRTPSRAAVGAARPGAVPRRAPDGGTDHAPPGPGRPRSRPGPGPRPGSRGPGAGDPPAGPGARGRPGAAPPRGRVAVPRTRAVRRGGRRVLRRPRGGDAGVSGAPGHGPAACRGRPVGKWQVLAAQGRNRAGAAPRRPACGRADPWPPPPGRPHRRRQAT